MSTANDVRIQSAEVMHIFDQLPRHYRDLVNDYGADAVNELAMRLGDNRAAIERELVRLYGRPVRRRA